MVGMESDFRVDRSAGLAAERDDWWEAIAQVCNVIGKVRVNAV